MVLIEHSVWCVCVCSNCWIKRHCSIAYASLSSHCLGHDRRLKSWVKVHDHRRTSSKGLLVANFSNTARTNKQKRTATVTPPPLQGAVEYGGNWPPSTYISQGSVETRIRCDGNYVYCIMNSLPCLKMKELWKSIVLHCIMPYILYCVVCSEFWVSIRTVRKITQFDSRKINDNGISLSISSLPCKRSVVDEYQNSKRHSLL